jgi:hypothetical protein
MKVFSSLVFVQKIFLLFVSKSAARCSQKRRNDLQVSSGGAILKPRHDLVPVNNLILKFYKNSNEKAAPNPSLIIMIQQQQLVPISRGILVCMRVKALCCNAKCIIEQKRAAAAMPFLLLITSTLCMHSSYALLLGHHS